MSGAICGTASQKGLQHCVSSTSQSLSRISLSLIRATHQSTSARNSGTRFSGALNYEASFGRDELRRRAVEKIGDDRRRPRSIDQARTAQQRRKIMHFAIVIENL